MYCEIANNSLVGNEGNAIMVAYENCKHGLSRNYECLPSIKVVHLKVPRWALFSSVSKLQSWYVLVNNLA